VTGSQQVFALIICALVFLLVFELVRRRLLREEYSVLWLLTSVLLFIVVLRYDVLLRLTDLIGAVLPTTTLFIFGILFLVIIAVQFSIRLSKMTGQLKNLAQENSLLRLKVQGLISKQTIDKL